MNRSHVVPGVLTALVALLAGVGVIDPSHGLVGALIALPMLAAMAGFVSVTAPHNNPTAVQNRRAVRVAVGTAATTATAVAATGGLADVAGGATGPVLLLTGFAAVPWVWPRLRRQADRLIARRRDGPFPVTGRAHRD